MINVTSLTEEEILERVVNIVREHMPESQLILFGSRAKGTNNNRSDFDFAIKKESLNLLVLDKIKDRVEELETLKVIEIIDYNELGDEFKTIVDTQGRVVYEN